MLNLLVPIKTQAGKINSPVYPVSFAGEKRIHIRVYDLRGVQEALETGAEFIYYDVFAADVEEARNLVKKSENKNNSSSPQFYVHTPMVLVDENIPKMVEIIEKIKPDGILVNNVGV